MTNQEAIRNLKDIKEIIYEVFPMTEEDKELSLDLAIKALEDRPKGKWVHCEQVIGLGGYWKCSCCGKPAIFTPRLDINNVQIYSWDNSKTNFCPNCGARME